jgi:hypothetical protein
VEVNANTAPVVDGSTVSPLGQAVDLSHVGALVGDASHAVTLPTIDVSGDVSGHETSILDVHVQTDHA